MKLNKGEYGQTLYFNLNEDVSSATKLEIVLKDPCGNESKKTATLGTTLLTGTGKGNFAANEWCEYTLAANNLDAAGRWMIRAEATFSARVSKTNWQPLVVKP
jgi:hypothetical protein